MSAKSSCPGIFTWAWPSSCPLSYAKSCVWGWEKGREGRVQPLCPYLIDAKADGVHVLAHLPLPPPVLLDEAHQEGTASLPILIIFIFFLQLDEVLRVHPEGIYGSGTAEHSLE